jgi:hypothetical protein
MPERTDRAIRDNWMLIGLIVVLLGVAAGAGIAFWPRLIAPTASQKQPEGQPLARSALLKEPLTVTLYCPVEGLLAPGTAAIPRKPDSQAQAREAIVALFADQRAALAAVLKEVKFKTIYLDAVGTAYVDLALPQQKGVKASAWEELTAIYSLVNTLLQNFEEIKQVRFLLDGKEAQTLAGHMDLSRTFTKRMDLVKQ